MLHAWKAAKAASEAELKALATWEAEVWRPFTASHEHVSLWR
jgi:hypothetical protein